MHRLYLSNARRKWNLFCLLCVFFIILITMGVFALQVNAENISGDENEDVSVDLTGKKEGFASVLYDNTNGLPTSEANAIAETDEGFLWIGSYSGLIRYDGNTFERIDSTTGITSVVSLYTDSRNRLWIGTNDNGLAVLDRGEYRFYDYVEGLQSSSIRSIVEDNDGYMIIATAHGLGIIDPDMELHPLDETQLNNEYICELRRGNDGVIYGETLSGAVFTLEDRKITGYYDGNKIGVGAINTIYPDPDNTGYVYIGTANSEMYYGKLTEDMAQSKTYDLSPLTNINSIEIFNGSLWVCADNGVGLLEGSDFTVIRNVPMNNSIHHMLVDYEGNLWFTSSRQGVMKIVPNQFTDINERYDLDSMVVNSTCKSGDTLYIGTDTGLAAINDTSIIKNIKLDSIDTSISGLEDTDNLISMLEDVRIRSIIKDSSDAIWFSTYSDLGLVRYLDGKVKTFTEEDGLPSNRVRTVVEASDGRIMVACSGGLVIIDDDEVVDLYDETCGISNTEILTVCEGDNGEIITGSDGNGIYVISGGKVVNYGRNEGLESEVVMRIKKDISRDIYWIITSNSIAFMKDGIIETVQEFPYSNNFDVYENTRDEMWILSSNGIYVTDVDELLENKEINPVYFSRDNGISSVTTANSYSYLDDNGDLYISGVSGVVKVNIESSMQDVNELKMAVPFIEADGRMIYPEDDGSFVIESNIKKITIYSYVYTYSLINPTVTFQLEGFDETPTTVERTELESQDYTNLDGGDYTYRMSIKTTLGEGDNSIDVLIHKRKSIYEKTWFKVLMSILILGLMVAIVMWYVRRKTRALINKQNENKKFIREMIEAFAKTIDMKDKYTNGHSSRVADYTVLLAKELGYDEETVDKYYNIALLHDIGKIGIPPEVLNKPGKLTDEEFNIIKSHSAQGYKVLKDISVMPELAIGAGAHHERPDGKGYPRGLKGDEIPRVAQIIAVADTFDAMYSDRPYRKRMNFDKAVSIIKEVRGTQLTEDVVDAFLRLVAKGEFRDPDDDGGGTVEDINNIHEQQKRYEEQSIVKISKR